jgi:flavin-dependent dehydrogenase
MNAHCLENEIAIAGTGIAAAAVAIQLLRDGFRPVLLDRGLPSSKGIEAISESALRLFAALDLLPALEQAGGMWVEGFENAWQRHEPILRSGRYIHVDRTALFQATIATAIDRGAVLISCHTMPALRIDGDRAYVTIDRVERPFAAAIDATGRSTIWSRSIQWQQREIAEIYHAIDDPNLVRGRIARIPYGWVYRLGLLDRMTVGVVRSQRLRGQIDRALVNASLGLSNHTQFSLIGRRPAFPQWAAAPIQDCRIAVGDAALASNPIAGQGIRFALSSALAAAAVVKTWRDSPANRDRATEFYNELVATERQQHLASIDALYFDEPVSPQPILDRTNLPATVCFIGQIKTMNLYIDGLIQPSAALILADGKAVRWLGNFDLLTLQEFGREPIITTIAIEHLRSNSMSQESALSLIQWCLEHEIFSSILPPQSTL